MKVQKRIGIIMSKVYKEINTSLLSGILEQAYAHGFSAYVYSLSIRDENSNLTHGERNLLKLINFSQLDGMIYLPYTLSSIDSTKYIDQFLTEQCPLPVVSVKLESNQFPNVWYDDRKEFEEIVTHLIEVHGCRKIHCLTGQEFQEVSLHRLAGYQDAMNKAGLPYTEDDITFGDFWMYSAQQLAEEFAAGVRELPDAVVCANDIMASSLCDALAKNGISVPDQILVTGYDGSLEAGIHTPAITTYSTSWRQLGRNAMCALYEQMTGEQMKPLAISSGELFCRESCGCSSTDTRKHDDYSFNFQRLEDNYIDSNLSAQLLTAESLQSFVKRTYHMTFAFLKLEHCDNEMYTICLCEDWDKTEMDGYTRSFRTDGYSDRMLWIDFYGNRHHFPTLQMVPDDRLTLSEPSVTFFTALHFQKHCFGYSLLTLKGIADGFNQHYQRFCCEVSNGLEFLCTRNELKSLAYRRYLSQIRDELTGLYNRSSFPWQWTELQKTAHQFDSERFVLGFSVVGLRRIKENYGSIEMDKLLVSFAEIMQNFCHNQEKCFRAGEGEFLLIGCQKPDAPHHDSLIQKISIQFEQCCRALNYTFRLRLQHIMITDCSSLEDGEAVLQMVMDQLQNSQTSIMTYSEQMHYDDLAALRNDIYQHPEREWSVTHCCQKLNISPSYFQRIYRNAFGVSCAHDIQNSKLEYAKKLLLNTSDTLQTIARKCGYDYSHFMRTFKKEIGMTPTEYRRGKNAT